MSDETRGKQASEQSGDREGREKDEAARDLEARIRERRAKLRGTVSMMARLEAEIWEQDAHLEELLDDVRGPSRKNQANGHGRGRTPGQLKARLRELEWEHEQLNEALESVEETVGRLHGKSRLEDVPSEADHPAVDEVDEASEESFPASDPPSFTKGHP